MVDLTDVIIAIIGLVFSIITALIANKVIPYLREQGLAKYARILVNTAQTMFEVSGGAEKFIWVFNKLADSTWGSRFDDDRLIQAIQDGYVNMCKDLGIEPQPMHSNDEIAKALCDACDDTCTQDEAQESETVNDEAAK